MHVGSHADTHLAYIPFLYVATAEPPPLSVAEGALPQQHPVSGTAASPTPEVRPRIVSPRFHVEPTTAMSSSFLASNQKALLFVGLQVLVIGTFIAWRKHMQESARVDLRSGSSTSKV